MAQDPRKFLVLSNASPSCNARHVKAIDNPKNNFYQFVKNLSSLEVQSGVFKGLRNIVSIVESGDGRFWNTQAVFDEVGIGGGTEWDTAQRMVNPSVINNGIGAARRVADSANNKNFGVQDIPEVIQELSVLKGAISSIFIGGATQQEDQIQVCSATNYAQDLLNFAPKFKFNFVVQFNTNSAFRGLLEGNDNSTKAAAFARNVERPTVTFQYEDVNMYGFRTKVLKSTEYGPATVTFYDDSKNRVMKYFTNYIKAISPIANLKKESKADFEEKGLQNTSDNRSSSVRALDDLSSKFSPADAGTLTILDEIVLYHVYHNGEFFNAYHFANPKIIEIQFDELAMEDTNVTAITIQFAYDAMFIDNEKEMAIYQNDGLTEASNMGRSKLRTQMQAESPSLSDEDVLLYEQVAAKDAGRFENGSTAAKDNGFLRNIFSPIADTVDSVTKFFK